MQHVIVYNNVQLSECEVQHTDGTVQKAIHFELPEFIEVDGDEDEELVEVVDMAITIPAAKALLVQLRELL